MRFHGVHGAQQGDSEALIEVSSCHGVKARYSCLIASEAVGALACAHSCALARALSSVVGIDSPRGVTGRIAQRHPESSLATGSPRTSRHPLGPRAYP